jgi:GNAT superfamily N-acetyltransferase
MTPLDLSNGYYELPKGKLANMVTCLEMLQAPPQVAPQWPEGFSLRRVAPDDLAAYRQLFRKVGQDLLWFSRLIMPDVKLAAILSNPAIESFAVFDGGEAMGLLELNFEKSPDCELAFFGLAAAAVGKGLGKVLMQEALARAWARPIKRLWVHTCNNDHPRALGVYQAAGFKPYALMVEVHDDPRLSGHLPLDSAPQVALIKY